MHLFDAIADASVTEAPQQKRRGLIWWFLSAFILTALVVLLAVQPFGKKTPVVNLGTFPADIPSGVLTEAQASEPVAVNEVEPVQNQEPIENPGNTPTEKMANRLELPTNKETGIILEKEPALQGEFLNKTIPPISEVAEQILDEQGLSLPSPPNPVLSSMIKLDLLNTRPDLIPTPEAALDSIVLAPSFSKKNWNTTIDFMASMDFVLRNLEAKEAAFADYAKNRDETETFRHGTSFGMRLSTVSENGFAVRSGLNYSTINEQLNLKIGEEERLIAKIKYAEDGSIIGTDTSLAVVGTYKIVNNRYSELDIPLLVGYEYAGEKVAFSFNGGVFINMLSAQKGEFLSPNTDESVSFSSADPNSYRAFRNRLGLGFYGSMGVYFQVNDNLQFLLEPYFKMRPGSYTVDGYVLDQRFMTTGLFVGVRKSVY